MAVAVVIQSRIGVWTAVLSQDLVLNPEICPHHAALTFGGGDEKSDDGEASTSEDKLQQKSNLICAILDLTFRHCTRPLPS